MVALDNIDRSNLTLSVGSQNVQIAKESIDGKSLHFQMHSHRQL